MLTFSLIAFSYALPTFPVNEENTDHDHVAHFEDFNDLFAGINEILKRDITKEIGDKSVEVGDKFTSEGDDGQLKISIQKFSFGVDSFPLTFKQNNDSVIDDKEITEIKGDFDDSAVYKIETDDSSESTTIKDEEKHLSTLIETTTGKDKNDKLLKSAVAQQPILTTI